MSQPAAPPPLAKKPQWAPRMWEGCDFFAWLKLLFGNRCAVSPRLWYIAIIITFVSLTNTLLRLLQDAIYGRAVRKTHIKEPPILRASIFFFGTESSWFVESRRMSSSAVSRTRMPL